MQAIRLGMAMDIAKCSDYYLIADHAGFKFYRLNDSRELEYIINELSRISTKEALIKKAAEKGFEINITTRILNKLLELAVVETTYFPENITLQELQEYAVPEEFYDDRFALQIAALKAYETSGHNRFEIQEKIRNAELTIIGAGGMGSNIAVMAAAIGVKKIKLIDNDYVEKGNLIRQIFYKESDCNSVKKVQALKRYLNEFSSGVEVEAVEAYIIDDKTAEKYLRGDSLIIQTADRPKGYIDWMVNKVCVDQKIPVLFTHNNSVGPFYLPGESVCFECFREFLDHDSKGYYTKMIENLDETVGSVYPAFVTGPWILSYYLFEEVLRFIIGIHKPHTMNHLLNLTSTGTELTSIGFKENCFCGGRHHRENECE